MKKLLYSLFALMAIVACSESGTENGENNSGGHEKPKQPEITLNATVTDFSTDGGSNEITFTSSVAWTAEVVNTRADAWCSINPTSGPAGTANITVTTKENDTPDDRTASIIIKAGTVSKTINVSQKQKDALTVTSSKFEVGAEGGEITIEVKANIDFEYAIDETAKEWITYQTTRAMKTSTLVFKVAKNNEVEKREGKIAIKSGDFNEVVTIYQAGEKPSIVITENEYVVSSDSNTIAVEVTSNVDVTVEIPADVDWISENTTRATSTNTYRFDILPNESYDQRSAEIKFTNKANGLSETVSVVQTQKDALIVAKTNYYVGSNGGNIHIELGHNIDFDIEISDDWITKIDTRAFSTETLTFDVAKNRSYNSRKGTITFKSKDSSLTQTVEIFQSQRDALIISNNDIVVSDDGGIVEFNIQSNVNFSVSAPNVDWVRAITTRGLTTHKLQYEVDPNTTYDSREAKIIVTNTENNKSETITITQAQKDAIVLAKSMYEFDIEGGELDLEVQTNVDLNVTISDDAQSWIHQIETRGLETKTLYFNIDACDENISRSATITITGGNATQEISIKQELMIPTNQIWYTTENNKILTLPDVDAFDANIVSHTYENGHGVIEFDKELTVIGKNAFKNYIMGGGPINYLTTITLPNSIIEIGDSAFCYCTDMTHIKIPNNVKIIGQWAFDWCYNLREIIIPESVEEIKYLAFRQCEGLKSLEIQSLKGYIGYGAFDQCFNLENVIISGNITEIRDYAFSACIKLTNILLPNSLISIGDYAFSSCESLKSITIPDNVKYIGDSVFAGCPNLNYFYGKFASTDNKYLVCNGELKAVARDLSDIIIPESVTILDETSFQGNKNIITISIPPSVVEIGNRAFSSCVNLKKIEFSEGIKKIGDGAFSGCKNLLNFTLSNSVTYIGNDAFSGCRSLTTFTIPNNVTYIGESVFSYCSNIAFYGKFATSDNKAIIYNNNLLAFSPLGALEYNIPDGVTSIGFGAFAGCSSMTKITIPKSVTSIGDFAFSNCRSLIDIHLPESVLTIGRGAFGACSSLKSVTIPKGVTVINSSLFQECTNLSYVNIHDDVVEIDAYAFYGSNLVEITLPKNLKEVGSYIFANCNNLLTIKFRGATPPIDNLNNDYIGLFYSDPQGLKILVPKEFVNDYKYSALYWYRNYIEGYDFSN